LPTGTAVRIDIELKCVRRAMSIGGLKWEAAIVAADHELSHTPSDIHDLGDDWMIAHAKFHAALVAACDSPWLLRIREQLFVQGERYRRIKFECRARIVISASNIRHWREPFLAAM
jgi:DNA-binding GntR family transcriptional regulator